MDPNTDFLSNALLRHFEDWRERSAVGEEQEPEEQEESDDSHE